MSVFEFIFSVALLVAFVVLALAYLRETSSLADRDWNPGAMSEQWRWDRESSFLRRVK